MIPPAQIFFRCIADAARMRNSPALPAPGLWSCGKAPHNGQAYRDGSGVRGESAVEAPPCGKASPLAADRSK